MAADDEEKPRVATRATSPKDGRKEGILDKNGKMKLDERLKSFNYINWGGVITTNSDTT